MELLVFRNLIIIQEVKKASIKRKKILIRKSKSQAKFIGLVFFLDYLVIKAKAKLTLIELRKKLISKENKPTQ